MLKIIRKPITLATTLFAIMGIVVACDQDSPMTNEASVREERIAAIESLSDERQQALDQVVDSMLDDQDADQSQPLTNRPSDETKPRSADWTPYTSEEYPPVTCDAGRVAGAARCSGSNCDNFSINCEPTWRGTSITQWSNWFSEENPAKYCPAWDDWITGVACNGSRCDDLSIQCTKFPSTTRKNCRWTGWMSEENGGTLYFGTGYHAVGIHCSGGMCDNKNFWVCQMGSV